MQIICQNIAQLTYGKKLTYLWGSTIFIHLTILWGVYFDLEILKLMVKKERAYRG